MQPYFQLYSQTAVKLNPFVWRTFKCNDSSDSWLWNGFLERALRIKTNNIIAVFFFFWFLFNYAIQGKSITWLVNSTLNCTWKPISHSSLRDSCDIGFCVQFNVEFPLQVMNFPIKFLDGGWFSISLVYWPYIIHELRLGDKGNCNTYMYKWNIASMVVSVM